MPWTEELLQNQADTTVELIATTKGALIDEDVHMALQVAQRNLVYLIAPTTAVWMKILPRRLSLQTATEWRRLPSPTLQRQSLVLQPHLWNQHQLLYMTQ